MKFLRNTLHAMPGVEKFLLTENSKHCDLARLLQHMGAAQMHSCTWIVHR